MKPLQARVFEHIALPDDWVQTMQTLASRGPIVYVLRNQNLADVLALKYLTKRHQLPALGFANSPGSLDLTQTDSVLDLLPRLKPRPSDEMRLQTALSRGASAALFLKRPPQVRDVVAGASSSRGVKGEDGLLARLLELQQHIDTPIQLVPLLFLWTNRRDTQGTNRLDFFLGPREWPSTVRVAGQVLANYRNAELRAGEPLSLPAYLREQSDLPESTLVQRLTYVMLRRLERERRAVTGPASIPPDLLRQRVLRNPQLQQVIRKMAGDKPENRVALTKQVDSILKEMQSINNAAALRTSRFMLDRIFERMYASIDVDEAGIAAVAECAKDGTVVLLPSHKSHVDYLVLSYVFDAHNLGLPLIAAGDNLSFFPLGPLARRIGAFFIRRSFKGDRLYAATVEAYVRRLLRDGNTIEVFLEGGRSRTGKLRKPQLGLLQILVNAALSMERRPVYFVPISIGYERLVEAEAFQEENTGRAKVREDFLSLLNSAGVLAEHYGRIDVQFGPPLTLAGLRHALDLPPSGALAPAKRRALVTRLANRAMDEINRVTEVTPGTLTAMSLLADQHRGVAHEVLVARCQKLLHVLQAEHARIHPKLLEGECLRESAVTEALQLFVDARLIQASHPDQEPSNSRTRITTGPDRVYLPYENKRAQLDTSKNHIVHFFVERGIAAVAALTSSFPMPLTEARDKVSSLSQLFKHEFRFRAGKSAAEIFDDGLRNMICDGELSSVEGTIVLGPGDETFSALASLRLYSALMRPFLEGYAVAASALQLLLKGPMEETDWYKRAAIVGERMFLADKIGLREAVSRPLFENALQAFRDEGYLTQNGDNIALSASCHSESAVLALEGRIFGHLHEHESHGRNPK